MPSFVLSATLEQGDERLAQRRQRSGELSEEDTKRDAEQKPRNDLGGEAQRQSKEIGSRVGRRDVAAWPTRRIPRMNAPVRRSTFLSCAAARTAA